MSVNVDSTGGRLVLSLNNVAGMMDLVILPLWVGGMIASFGYSPVLAGGIVTLYLIGVLLANLAVSRRFGDVSERFVAAAGFGLAALLFAAIAWKSSPGAVPAPALMAVLHLCAGFGAGAALAVVHGTIGRSANPHGAFAIANLGVGIFGIAFFATVPGLMVNLGVAAVFLVAACVIGLAALAAALAFPNANAAPAIASNATAQGQDPRLRFAVAGIVLLMLGNAITLSFAERIGALRGFAPGSIAGMLVAGGIMALVAPILAHLAQHKVAMLTVVILGPIVHGLLSLSVSNQVSFLPYAISYVFVVPTIIFVHTFMFDMLSKFDTSGRTNAATASMMMFGAATGPFLGGAVAEIFGYAYVGVLAAAAAFGSGLCFARVRAMGRGLALKGTAQ